MEIEQVVELPQLLYYGEDMLQVINNPLVVTLQPLLKNLMDQVGRPVVIILFHFLEQVQLVLKQQL